MFLRVARICFFVLQLKMWCLLDFRWKVTPMLNRCCLLLKVSEKSGTWPIVWAGRKWNREMLWDSLLWTYIYFLFSNNWVLLRWVVLAALCWKTTTLYHFSNLFFPSNNACSSKTLKYIVSLSGAEFPKQCIINLIIIFKKLNC